MVTTYLDQMENKTDYPGKKRIHLNILLEPYRGQLLLDHVEKEGKKRSDVLRDIIYDFLRHKVGAERYAEAVQQDSLEWQQVTKNRVSGRQTSREMKQLQTAKQIE